MVKQLLERVVADNHAILPREGGESFALGAGFACPVHPGKPTKPSAVADVRGSATGYCFDGFFISRGNQTERFRDFV